MSVDLKYILLGQSLYITFESSRRHFTITRIYSQKESTADVEDLTDDIISLSINSSAFLWVANWDTEVKVLEDTKTKKVAPEVIHVIICISAFDIQLFSLVYKK